MTAADLKPAASDQVCLACLAMAAFRPHFHRDPIDDLILHLAILALQAAS